MKDLTKILHSLKIPGIVVGTLLLFLFTYIGIIGYANEQENKMSSNHKKTYVIKDFYIYDIDQQSYYNVHKDINKEMLIRIISQLELIRSRSKAHDAALSFLYTHFYFFIVLQALFTFGTITLGLFLSKKGWDNINANTLVFFFIISGLLIFSKMMPESMNFKQNININKHKLIQYRNIQNTTHSYISTHRIDGVYVDEYEFIYLLDKKINDYNDITFEIDEVPSQKYQQEALKIRDEFK